MKKLIGFTLLLMVCLTAKSQEDFSAIVRLRDNDPIVEKYSHEQMLKALEIKKYANEFKSCAMNLDKFFRLRDFKDIFEKPGRDGFWAYLRALEDRGSAGLYSYANELNPYPEYNAGQYMASEEEVGQYKKLGIDLLDASSNNFTSLFNWYRDVRLKTGSMGSYVLEKMEPKDLDAVTSSLQKKWGSQLGPGTDYRKVVEDYFEAQLMIYVEKKLAALYPVVYKPLLTTIPSCRELFLAALKETEAQEKNEALISSGTYTDNISTIRVNYSGGYIGVSFEYSAGDSRGSGSWDCKVEGNKVSGTWTAQHEDNTKSGTRKGTVTASFDGNTITGSYIEDTPSWSYKQGYSAANVSSSMVKGKNWPFTLSKKN